MRRRLLVIAIASAALVAVAFAVPLGALVRDVTRDRAITAAERDAAALAPVLAVTDDADLVTGAIERTDIGADGRLFVLLPDGTQLGDQVAADAGAITLVRNGQVTFSQATSAGLDLYTPVVTGNGEVTVIRARVPNALLNDGVVRSWLALAGIAITLIAASAFVADRLARRLIGDADDLASTANALAEGDGTARALASTTPELDQAGRALNLLADRIDELRAAERERVADLSHRLRTPLTALRLDAERSNNPDMTDGVDRLEAAVTDLIRAARRPLHDQPVRARCDAAQIVRERAEFWSALADDDGRSWTIDATNQPLVVGCEQADLEAAVDALVANVFAHTPGGTEYAIDAIQDGDEAVITVGDAGPGIDDDRITERGRTNAGSTGLGLSIATETAAAAGGRLTVGASTLGGTRVTLHLPLR